MVQGKKPSDMSNTNGTPKSKYQQPNMAFPRKEPSEARGGTNDGRVQNGNASSFRTDSAISGSRNQGERVLQRWVPDAPEDVDGSLESTRMKASGRPWDQFAENERLFGVKTDYDENIYTTPLDKSHPQYKQRIANAEITAREIERSAATNSHVAEERVTDNIKGGDMGDEEDKYSGVRRQQDFPPLSSTNNKYTPPARRAPTGQSTVAGAPVDPAIISSQLARPDKSGAEKKASPGQTPSKPEAATPPTTTELSVTPEPKVAASAQTSSASHNASPQVKSNATPNATATVERDVLGAYKTFATRERINVATIRTQKARNDKEVKLNDLKKFADSFKLNTPVPKDLVSIIAKDPAKQQEIQEKAKRNAEAAKANPAEAAKTIPTTSEAKPATRPIPTTHGATPSTNAPARQNTNRNPGFQHQGPYNNSQSFRTDRPGAQQAMPSQQARPPGNLGQRLRNIEQQNKHTQLPVNPMPIHEPRLPPTGPSNAADPNFSRRSSGVTSAQGGRLNPNSSEFRPSPHAATFNPNGNPSSGSSPRSAANAVEPPTPATKSLLKHKPVPTSERPSLKEKFNALEHTQSIKPPPGKDWAKTGGTKPAFDTAPTWRSPSDDEKPESTMHLTYPELFEMAPFPTQTLSSPNPSHAIPQVPHQYQLPLHLQQGVHPRQSPRQPPMNLHGNQHGHGPTPPFNGPDDHRMMPSQSAQSYASPRPHNVPMAFPSSPMGQPQLPYNAPMVQYPGAPPMQGFRSLSQNHQFMPQQQHMGPIMMQNPANGFMTSQGMAPGPQVIHYPPGGQNHFIPPQNGHPPPMPGVNGGYPSPGRSAAPMMMSQGSQQGHQSQPPMYGNVNPGMSPGPQYGQPIYQQSPGQMPMRGYNGPHQFGTSPQQMHQYGPQHRNNHPNGNYNNNNKNFQPHGQHPNGPSNNQIPNGPQARASEGGEEAK